MLEVTTFSIIIREIQSFVLIYRCFLIERVTEIYVTLQQFASEVHSQLANHRQLERHARNRLYNIVVTRLIFPLGPQQENQRLPLIFFIITTDTVFVIQQ